MSDKERNNLVYDRFIMPVKLHYYGHTDDVDRRKRAGYNDTVLQQYIDEYGWDNISTTIVTEGLTKKEAEQLEDKLIKEGWERGDCINKQGSGGEWRDNPEHRKWYMKQYQETHKEERKQYMKRYNKQYNQENKVERLEYNKQRLSTPEYKIYNRVNGYNHNHPDRMIETALEAKQKYLETGYIPTYIKNNDLK